MYIYQPWEGLIFHIFRNVTPYWSKTKLGIVQIDILRIVLIRSVSLFIQLRENSLVIITAHSARFDVDVSVSLYIKMLLEKWSLLQFSLIASLACVVFDRTVRCVPRCSCADALFTTSSVKTSKNISVVFLSSANYWHPSGSSCHLAFFHLQSEQSGWIFLLMACLKCII